MTVMRRLAYLNKIGRLLVWAECRWFDAWHNVDTAADDAHAPHDPVNLPYEPTRPGRIRAIFRDLPIGDYARYTFVDFGSGKGRVLLMASEFPFQAVEGVELRRELHQRAVENIGRCRFLRPGCSRIESLHLNATEYSFPHTPLVLYFFNPFGRAVMEQVMQSLSESLEERPRDVIVALFNPECASAVSSVPQLQLHGQGKNYHIYSSRT